MVGSARTTMFSMLVLAAAAAADAQDTARFSAQQVAPGIHMLVRADGGNVGLSVGEDGVFMIDDHLPPSTPRLLEAVRSITPDPVRMLINTHFHFDHAGGNEPIGTMGAIIVAHDNVRRRLSADQFYKAFDFTQKQTAKSGLPVITFSRDVTFHLNRDEIHAFHARNAHTDGDAVVYFRNANVIHTGDIFFNGSYPFIDVAVGGSIDGMIEAVERLVGLATAGTKIIPGHGPLADRAALIRYRDMLLGTRSAVNAAMQGNRTIEEVKAARPTAAWDGVWGGGFMKPDQYVESLYQSLSAASPATSASAPVGERLAKYTPVRLAADTTGLSANERRMLPLLIDAARAMHEVFWIQSYGNRDSLLSSITNPRAREFAVINVGPWDRLDDNAPFLPGVGPKPEGSNLYPRDMTKAEFEAAVAGGGARADSLKSLYTLVRRNAAGRLIATPYHHAFAAQHQHAARRLREAAALAEDAGLRRYLTLRADALLDDDYQASDIAWLDMKSNTLDIVIGPIETYEDALFGYKAAHEAYVLVKDRAWSSRLSKYAAMLPALQRGIPVPDAYKQESPGSDSDLNAYDVVYVAGDANAGSKTIAINLPNDEAVQLQKGTRRLQLKNAMRAKFDKILLPISRELIAGDQLDNVTFDAFFSNVMFHEVAHGLGIKNTINGRGPVRTALKERYSALEEGKSDILGLYMIRELHSQGELGQASLDDNYVTFLASLFRSIRFGAASAHGRANVAAFNFLQGMGAFTRGPDGKYRVDPAKMRAGADSLSRMILTMQGDGDYEGVGRFNERFGTIGPVLRADLDRLQTRAIPVDIVYEQGR